MFPKFRGRSSSVCEYAPRAFSPQPVNGFHFWKVRADDPCRLQSWGYALIVALAACVALSGVTESAVESGSHDSVPEDVSVCELISAGEVEDAVVQQIDFVLFRVASPDDQNELKCSVSLEVPEMLFREIVIT